MDNPHIRASLQCPLCGSGKDIGLVACWPCYRARLKHGGDHHAEQRLADTELFLSRRAAFPGNRVV